MKTKTHHITFPNRTGACTVTEHPDRIELTLHGDFSGIDTTRISEWLIPIYQHFENDPRPIVTDGTNVTKPTRNRVASKESSVSQREFGPFLIPLDYPFPIAKAGWVCRDCNKPVEKLIVCIPGGILRAHFYRCHCVCVGVWADEQQPHGASHWQMNVRLAQKTGAELLVFNGNKPLPPDFQGFS